MTPYETRKYTYRQLLIMLNNDQQLNEWERGFISSLLSKDELKFSDKQKDKLLTMTRKSRVGMYHKVILTKYVKGME